MTQQADITIIGAGVIGLAIAAEVADKARTVYVLEKNETFGQETSSRNSQVIHAGIYYPEDSLKAKTCVAGNALLYQLCDQYGIGCQRLGKLVVATSDEGVERLEALLKQGERNGVSDLRMLSQGEIKEIEPNIKAIAALLSPSTGIIDSHGLMRCFATRAAEKGAKLVYQSEVIGIEKVSTGYRLTIEDSSGLFSFETRVAVNCAGLNSDRIAQMAGIDINEAGYRLHHCKGDYFSVGKGKNKLIKRLVYPAPQPEGAGLGIHATLDLEGKMMLGPNDYYVDKIDYRVDASQRKALYKAVKEFLPFIEYNDLEPEMAGIRPKLQGPGEHFRDFVIRHEYDRGLPGFIDLVGIESPGLTSSPAIAKYVGAMVEEALS